jgi:hypothetical protein
MRLLYEHMIKENNKTAAAAVSATATTTTAAMTTTTTAAAATTPSLCQCQPSNPELSSLIDYLNENNYSTIYSSSSNFKFLWNIWTNNIPPHSSYWHPQSYAQWLEAQPGNATFGVLFALLVKLLDSGLAKRLAKKYKVNPSAWGKVKMTQVSLFSLNCRRRCCHRRTWQQTREKGETRVQSFNIIVRWKNDRRYGPKIFY